MSGLTEGIDSRMFKLLSGILSKNGDRKDRSLVRGRSARHPWSLVRMLGRYDAATTTIDNVRHWAAADGLSASAANGWRATVGTLKDASIEFTVLNKEGDSAFGMLQGLWSSGDPCDVGISDAGGTLTLTCEVMTFNVNQNLEEVISADVTLKPTQSTGGGGMNVGPGLAGP